MKHGLLIGLSALVCQILARVNIPAVQDLDIQKFSGKWYLIAQVMDKLVTEDTVKVGTTVTAVGGKDILLNMVIRNDDGCYSEKVQLEQTQQPGEFKVTVGDIIVHIVEVDYDNYHILHFTTADNRILQLYTRRKRRIREEQKKFRKAARSLKFDLNKMTFEPRNVKCPSESANGYRNPHSHS